MVCSSAELILDANLGIMSTEHLTVLFRMLHNWFYIFRTVTWLPEVQMAESLMVGGGRFGGTTEESEETSFFTAS